MANDIPHEFKNDPARDAERGVVVDGVASMTGTNVGSVAGPAGTVTGTAAGVVAGVVVSDAAAYDTEGDDSISRYDDTISDPDADADIEDVRGMGEKVADFVLANRVNEESAKVSK